MSAVELRAPGRLRTRAAVVGSGFGGLAVAIRLQNAGFDTCIFEANDQPGGRAGETPGIPRRKLTQGSTCP